MNLRIYIFFLCQNATKRSNFSDKKPVISSSVIPTELFGQRLIFDIGNEENVVPCLIKQT